MWRQDPISQIPLALGAYWGGVKPFVLRSAERYRAPEPPGIDSEEYAVAFDEVKRLGGDGKPGGTPTERTEDQTFAGIFWAYDGTPSLCAPPRLYNQITVQIAEQVAERKRKELSVDRAGAAAGAREHGDGRRGHRDLGVEVLLRLLAPDHRDPGGRRGDRARPEKGTGIRTRRAIRTSRRWERRPAT